MDKPGSEPNIPLPERDAETLRKLAEAIEALPEEAFSMLTYAYGLGYCEGREKMAARTLEIMNAK